MAKAVPFFAALALLAFATPAGAQPAAAQTDLQRLVLSGRAAARRGDLAGATRIGEQALSETRTRFGDDHPNTAIALADLAAYRREAGVYAEAEAPLTEALATATRRLGRDHPVTLAVENEQAVLRERQGRYAEAAALQERVLAGRERVLGPANAETIASLNNLGLIYGQQQRTADARRLLRRALERAERSLPADAPLRAAILSNLGQNSERAGRFDEAEAYYARAEELRRRILGEGNAATIALLGNRGVALARRARFAEAEPLLLEGVAASERALGADHPQSLAFLNTLAGVYERQNRFAEARPLYERVLAARERTLGPTHPATLATVNSLGVLYGRQGRGDLALPLLTRALDGRRLALGETSIDTLTSINNVANVLQNSGRAEEAEQLFRDAFAAAERALGRDNPETLRLGHNLARLYGRRQRIAEAEPLFARILDARRRVLGPDHPETAATAANFAALRLAAPGRARDALEPARLAVAALRARRAAALSDGYGEAQAEREQLSGADFSLLLAEAAWAQGAAAPALSAEAFAALQEAMAGAAEEAVTRMAVRRIADAAGSGLGELVREREALAQIWDARGRDYSAALGAEGAEARASGETARAERAALEARLAAIDARLRADFPQYFALIRPEPLDLAVAQAMLAPDEALLLVAPTPAGTQIVAVTREGLTWRRSDWNRERVNAAVRRLLWDVGANVRVPAELRARWEAEQGEGFSFDRLAAFELYRAVVAPAAAALAGKRHLFIAAAGALSTLPFGMLVTAPPQGGDADPAALRATRWFADAYALVQLPSLQSLQFLRRAAPRSAAAASPGDFIGFGDPVLQGQATQRGQVSSLRDGAVADPAQLRRLARLPGTATELENMRAALGAPASALYLGERATERALRAADLSRARILALATHGLMAGEIGGMAEPGLVFTPPATPSAEDDGYLAASEIATLRLDADWVILSACNTAAGDGSGGSPGLSGLARAFFYAGARALLASHWPVRDDVAARLTVRTLQIQRADPALSRAEALQRAMREIRADAAHDSATDSWAHPNAWAPFTLIGDGAR